MQRASDMFSSATSNVGSGQTGKLTWACIAGEQGTLGDYYGNATWTREGCGIIGPLEIRPGRFIRKACPCERAFRDQCRKALEIEAWRKAQIPLTYAWLGHRYDSLALATKTFDNFDQSRQLDAWETANLFMNTLAGTLIVHGPYGTGKTHLLAAVCNEMHKRMKTARFVTAPKLFNAIQARIGANESYAPIIQQAITTPLLVIDDIDKCKWTEFREEVYFEIIDERVNAGRPIAISTNRFAELEKYIGGACASRLCIGLIEIEMDGVDYRREML